MGGIFREMHAVGIMRTEPDGNHTYFALTTDGERVVCNGKPKGVFQILNLLRFIEFGVPKQADGTPVIPQAGEENAVALECHACSHAQNKGKEIYCKLSGSHLRVAKPQE